MSLHFLFTMLLLYTLCLPVFKIYNSGKSPKPVGKLRCILQRLKMDLKKHPADLSLRGA